eukprot:gene27770-36598_t
MKGAITLVFCLFLSSRTTALSSRKSNSRPIGSGRSGRQENRFQPPTTKSTIDKSVESKIISDFSPSVPTKTKSYAVTTILGQNIINCRSFSLETQKQFNFLGSYKSYQQIPIYPRPEIAFLGRSNVGKSSLLNCLTGLHKNIAVESKTPGRTQSINIFGCRDKQGDICNFVDLPGYGYAKISKAMQEEVAQFILQYLENRTSLRVAVVLVDIRRSPQEADQQTLQLLDDLGIPTIVVATKSDKVSAEEAGRRIADLQTALAVSVMPFSSVSGQGRRELWKALRDGIVGDVGDDDSDSDGGGDADEDELDEML